MFFYDSSFVGVKIHSYSLTKINKKSFTVNNTDTFIFKENIHYFIPNPCYDILAFFVGKDDINDEYYQSENLFFIDLTQLENLVQNFYFSKIKAKYNLLIICSCFNLNPF